MTYWYVISALGVLLGASLLFKKRILRLVALLSLVLTLIEREFSIGPFYRSLITHKHAQGELTDQFREGAGTVVDYVQSTQPQIIVVYGLLLTLGIASILAARGKSKE